MVDIGGISETAATKAKELAAFASEKAKSTLGPVYDKALEKGESQLTILFALWWATRARVALGDGAGTRGSRSTCL